VIELISEFAGFLASVAPILGMMLFAITQMHYERELKNLKRGLNWAVLKIHDKLDD